MAKVWLVFLGIDGAVGGNVAVFGSARLFPMIFFSSLLYIYYHIKKKTQHSLARLSKIEQNVKKIPILNPKIRLENPPKIGAKRYREGDKRKKRKKIIQKWLQSRYTKG